MDDRTELFPAFALQKCLTGTAQGGIAQDFHPVSQRLGKQTNGNGRIYVQAAAKAAGYIETVDLLRLKICVVEKVIDSCGDGGLG